MSATTRPPAEPAERLAASAIRSLRALQAEQHNLEWEIAKARAVVASALADLREVHGLSLREIAPHAGCSIATLHDIEHCRRWSDRIVKALLAFYGVRP